jgi:hypothetical protein
MEIITISVQQLEAILDSKVKVILDAITPEKKQPSDQWFDLNGLIQYLPSHPKPQTIYEWVHKGIIPYHKSPDTKMLSFLKSEIDDWMKTGRRKTQSEKDVLVNNYLNNKNNKKWQKT